jgi:penicillin-binding protein 1A
MATTTSRSRSGSSSKGAKTDRPRWRRWALWLAIPGLVVMLLLAAWVFVAAARVPLPEDLAPGSTTVFDRDGNQVGSLTGDTTRQDVDLQALPEHTRLAVLGAEDRGFYEHQGISPLGILRAMVANVRSGSIAQGGSTISQQYVKNSVVGTDQTFTRKLHEAALAIKMDRQYDKDTVLGWYLDTIYWGRGAYGIGAASETYFGIPATELNLNQSATLAGMIASPENYDPAESPDRVDARRLYVLDGMLSQGWISQDEHDRTVALGLPEVTTTTALASATAPYYLDAVRRELRRVLGDGAQSGDLRVYTGLDLDTQRIAERAVQETLADHGLDADDLTAAVVTLDPVTGEARAVVGGADFAAQSYNTAIRSLRQVGSTFKVFTLQAWLEDGKSPESRFNSPATLEVDDKEDGISDYAGRDRGRITLFEAMAVSANTVFAQVQQEVGTDNVVDAAVSAGMPERVVDEDGQIVEDPYSRGSSMTLGVDEFTPWQLANAFNTYAAEGLHIPAHTITRVESATGEVLYEADTSGEARVAANDVRTLTESMRRVIRNGTGGNADIGRPAAGKTGTTQGGADGWFAGYTPDLTTVAWVGRFASNQPVQGLGGGGLPAILWQRVMSEALEGVEPSEFTPPDLSVYEVINPEPEECPEGWHQAGNQEDVTPEPDDDETEPVELRTEILEGTEDREGGPCIRVEPVEPEETETDEPTEEPTDVDGSPLPGLPGQSPSPSPSPTESETEPTEEPTEEETDSDDD